MNTPLIATRQGILSGLYKIAALTYAPEARHEVNDSLFSLHSSKAKNFSFRLIFNHYGLHVRHIL